jgi:myo-inositol-1(or 4)-monophosphatase
MPVDTADALAFAVDTARAAGEVVLRLDGPLPGSRRGQAPRMKGPRDPVTAADLASERLIVERLRARWPDAAIVAEEETRDAAGDGLTFYVDPLDGTVNFSQAHPFFAVSIALYRGSEPLVAVVHAPRLRETFAARAGGGATLNGERLAVSDKVRLEDALLATGFAYRRNELPDDNVQHVVDFVLRVRDLRRCGSAALDLAYVAAGRLDGFWEPHLNPWDVAAGALLVREAGGLVTGMDGGAAWLHGGSILAAPAALHAAMARVLAGDAG